MIEHVIIVHFHELSLKGKNRSWFEKTLLKNIKRHLIGLPYSNINRLSGRIIIGDIDFSLWDRYTRVLSDLIGIRNFILASKVDLDIDQIKEEALKTIKLDTSKDTFRVSARRQNKNFKLNSNEINQIVGEHIVKNTDYSVNLGSPDIDLIIEIVNETVFIGTKKINAFGGLPVGTGEKGLSLISSGID